MCTELELILFCNQYPPSSPQAAQNYHHSQNHGEMPPQSPNYSFPPRMILGAEKNIQTDLTCLLLQNMEAKSASDLEKKNTAITDLERVSLTLVDP